MDQQNEAIDQNVIDLVMGQTAKIELLRNELVHLRAEVRTNSEALAYLDRHLNFETLAEKCVTVLTEAHERFEQEALQITKRQTTSQRQLMETLDKSLKDLKFGLIQLNDDIVPALRNELDEVRSTAEAQKLIKWAMIGMGAGLGTTLALLVASFLS